MTLYFFITSKTHTLYHSLIRIIIKLNQIKVKKEVCLSQTLFHKINRLHHIFQKVYLYNSFNYIYVDGGYAMSVPVQVCSNVQ